MHELFMDKTRHKERSDKIGWTSCKYIGRKTVGRRRISNFQCLVPQREHATICIIPIMIWN